MAGDGRRRRAAARRHRPRRRRQLVVRGHGPRSLALVPGARRQRRPDPLPPPVRAARAGARVAPVDHVRRHLLPGRRVARRRLPRRSRGILLPPQLRRHCALAPRRRPRARRRGDVQPGARHDRTAQRHRAVPALGGRRPRLEPGRPLATGARLRHRAGQARPPAGAVPRRRRISCPPPPPHPPRQRCRPHGADSDICRRHRRRRGRAPCRRRGQRDRVGARPRSPPAVVAARAR